MIQQRRELTTKELSAITGVSLRTAQYWVSGRVTPSAAARRLLEQLGVQLDVSPRRKAGGRR